MNYELAQQLKDAGFIQRKWKYAQHYIPDKNELGEQMIVLYENYEGSGDDLVYIPDLLELIEVCGDRFAYLSPCRDPETAKVVAWTAKDFTKNQVDGFYEGSTPEEAVAKLYLALHA